MKTAIIKFMCVSAALLAASVRLSAQPSAPASEQDPLVAQTDAQFKWNDQYRSSYEVPVGEYVGRSPYMRGGTNRPPPPAPPPVIREQGNTTWAQVRLTKNMPKQVAFGTEFMAELIVTATGNASTVVVRDTLPDGVTYVRSEPAGTAQGNQIVWRLNVEAGKPQSIRLWLRADKEGSLDNCATATVEPQVCTSVFVGRPVLAIQKSGPATATVGSQVAYNIVVRNTGSAVANDVVVTDSLPEGLSHSSGYRDLSFKIGNLAPGESKAVSIAAKADRRGRFCNLVSASSSNAEKVASEACTIVQVASMKVEKSGTKAQITGRNADYEIAVINTGDTVLNVAVTDTAPEGTMLVAAPEATINGNRAVWMVSELKPGERKVLQVKLTGKMAGNLCNNVTATAAGLTETAQACTAWRGVAAVLLEAVDNPDPIQVGETTTYTVRVTNQGFADIHNVKITVAFDAETAPVGSPQGTVEGNNVNFAVMPVIEPKRTLVYTITTKGVKAGDSRNKVILSCDELKSPVVEEESTMVY